MARILWGHMLLVACLFLEAQGPEAQGQVPQLELDQVVHGEVNAQSPVVETAQLARWHATLVPAHGVHFRFSPRESGWYTFSPRSYSFNPYVVVQDSTGGVLAEDDTDLSTALPHVDAELVGGEPYTITVCATYGDLGLFTLRVQAGPAPDLTPATVEEEVRLARAGLEAYESGDSERASAFAHLQLGLALMEAHELEEAQVYLEAAVEALTGLLGREHPRTVRALHDLGVLLTHKDRIAAGRLFGEALALREATLGPSHPDTIATFRELIANESALGRYRESLPRADLLVERCSEAWGPDDLRTSDALYVRGVLRYRLGNYAGARSDYEESISIAERVEGPGSPAAVGPTGALAIVLKNVGELDAAIELERRVLERTLAVHGPESDRTAAAHNNLAVSLKRKNQYEQALPHYERALEIWEEVYGPDHRRTAYALNNLGLMLMETGKLESARPLLERALSIRQQTVGAEVEVVSTAHNLGGLFSALGDHERAIGLLTAAAEGAQGTLGATHPTTLTIRKGLGEALVDAGKYEEALAVLEDVLVAREALANRRSVAVSLVDLGGVLYGLERHEEAIQAHERGLEIMLEHGTEHDVGHTLTGLAGALHAKGEWMDALPRYQEALAIYEEHGASPGKMADLRYRHALLLAEMGDARGAWERQVANELAHRTWARTVLASLSEAERFAFVRESWLHLELLVVFAASLAEPEVGVRTYESVLAWKGRVLRTVMQSRERLMADQSPERRAAILELRAAQRRLSSLAFDSSSSGDDPEERARALAAAREERNRLEVALRRSGDTQDGEAVPRFAELRDRLPEGAALVDFLVHRSWELGEGEESWLPNRVTAWITRKGLQEPTRVDLGAASELEDAVRKLLESLRIRRGVRVSEEASTRPDGRLARLLWEPLAPHLEGVETVFVSPDDFLGGLPFGVLPMADGSFLLERLSFVYLDDVNALMHPPASDGRNFDTLVAVGGVDFRERAEGVVEGEGLSIAATPLRGRFTDYWGRLPATRYESQVVADLHEDAFGSGGRRTLLQGPDATEERLKRELPECSVAHLATHGFFNPGGVPSLWEAVRGADSAVRTVVLSEDRRLAGSLPGLLSGLVCAGANRPEEEREDGFLTADEVAWLDLSNMDLVLLSACDTGLGRPQAGEGLVGLRRAFLAAGARTVISSLWSVQDEATAELMQGFYRNHWGRGMGCGEALRRAQLDILSRNRRDHADPLPATWGAFVLSGDWR